MKSLKLNLAILTTVSLWASAFIGIRIGLADYTPGSLALFRFLVASVCMVIVYPYSSNLTRISNADKAQLFGIGIVAIGIYNLCLNIGEITVSAGIASFIIGLMPVFTLILSIIFLKEKPNFLIWVGILISFIGFICIIKGEELPFTLNSGVLVILISTFVGAMYTISQKRYLQVYHPIAITAWVIWGGTFLLLWFLPSLLFEFTAASQNATWAAVYMGIFPAAIAYMVWSYVLKQLPAWKASAYLYFMPAFSTLLGLVFLHEHPTMLSMLGGFIALAGAFIATRARQLLK